MFRFFKRKKAKEENQASQEAEVAQAHEQEEPAASEAIVPEEPVTTSTDTVTAETVEESAVAIERVETVASTVESSVTPVPLEPQPEVLVTEVEAEAEASSPAPVADAEMAPSPVVTEAAPAKSSWMQRLRQGLSRTGSSIGSLFVGVKVDEALFEELEMALLMADAGIEATESLLAKLRTKVKQQRIEDAAEVKEALKALLSEHLKPLEKDFMLPLDGTSVVMIAGVNGAGKTTSIGKLAHHFQAAGASVLLAAGDTFRAAAREQLVEWGKRNQVAVIAQDGGDPAAVAFDAVNAGKARKANVVMVDTAGRLPTQLHLMEELKKIKRVINKADSEAPHEVLLVVDGNTGQNVITQIKAFDAALGLTGLVVTKLDGTAKGGTLAAVAAGSQGVRPIPVYWIGVGESLHDLQPFSAAEFANALLG
ncbi:signal recognition particle-docking protein FtsY [Oligella urethralis]|uniref:signal recognition particle-docking protein FtsY n=1 Tax=Oligella urethralis TaxID=90245 RepID=UPI000C9C804F|nr:signal recognition particle-docking protein FtsY [Oligella urethralis]PMC17374.1 signal recognition particle-docking protein FtsY [Oligella urethralis]